MKSRNGRRREFSRLLALAAIVIAVWALPAERVSADTPHLDAVAERLHQRNPDTEGKIWWFTDGNQLLPGKGWLLQTPSCWGSWSCATPPPGGQYILSQITDMVASAEHSLDVANLYQQFGGTGFPDGKFLDAIVNGLKKGHELHPDKVPYVRFLIGLYPPNVAFPDRVVTELQNRVGSWVKVQAAYMRTTPTTFNHEKVIAVDGQTAIVGGMNYWSGDYLDTSHPVNDLSMRVTGPAAAKASSYTDLLWKFTCDNRSAAGVSVATNTGACLSSIPTERPPRDGEKVPIIVVGHLGEGIDVPGQGKRSSGSIPKAPVDGTNCNQVVSDNKPDHVNGDGVYEYRNPGENALRALLLSARRSIFISQQDLLSCVPQPAPATEAKFDERLFSVLATKIHAGRSVTIVLSDKTGGGYGNGWVLRAVAAVLKDQIQHQIHVVPREARMYVCDHVSLAYISNNGSDTWRDGKAFHNHAKLVSVDDQAFYIGSQNFYPSRLQELGMIVENPRASQVLRDEYLNPLWKNSRWRAYIDPDKKKCGDF